MFPALLVAALFGQFPVWTPGPVVAPPADAWYAFPANPAYEVLGHLDARGVLVYTQSRPKAAPKAAPVKNFGLNLPKHEPILSASDFEVTGTDKALGQSIAEAAIAPARAGPCPAPGPCPVPQPGPEQKRPHLPTPHVPAQLEREALVVVAAVALAAIVGFAVLVLVLATIVMLVRFAWRSLAAVPPETV